jgi:thiol-disulfide isomerase/thioredoxin
MIAGFGSASNIEGAAMAASGNAAESSPTLTVGSMAPGLPVEKWVKGAPVRAYERGRVYVVEFWATWCTPCKASIPHLTELQQKHKNIVIVSIAASEQASRPNVDDRLTKVQTFVDQQGSRMDFTIGYDGSGAMWKTWMAPAQRGGIPVAFIVGADGRIAWIGHPLIDEFDRELEAALARPGVRKDTALRWPGPVAPGNNHARTSPEPQAKAGDASKGKGAAIASSESRQGGS